MGRSRALAAAGCVVVRPAMDGSEPQVLLVHRPRYDDWSLPKGKLDPDEYLPGCAVRETLEESSVTVRLGPPALRQLVHPVNSGEKTVWYWRAEPTRIKRHKPTAEVDEVVWLPVSEALTRVSYLDEMDLITSTVAMPQSIPLIIARHTKAMLRAHWSGRDQARPLDARGRRQADLLVPFLQAYGIQRAVSSSSKRCLLSLRPFAKQSGLEIESWSTLSEEQAKQQPSAVTRLMKRLRAEVVDTAVPTVVCGHRPVLPLMFEALGLEPRPLKPGAALVVHLSSDGSVIATEEHKPRI